MLQLVVRTWRLWTLSMSLEAAWTEVERLRSKLGKESDSIWKMNKAELVELARRELGMSLMEANDQTVIMLRERIRARREMLHTVADPNDALPKGLNKMPFADTVVFD